MSFGGFGKNSGPTIPPKTQPPFGHFPRPPSTSPPPSFPAFLDSSAPQQSSNPRTFGASERVRHPSPLKNALPSTSQPEPSVAPSRTFGASERVGYPFPSKNDLPSTGPSHLSVVPSTSSRAAALHLGNRQISSHGEFGGPIDKGSSPSTSHPFETSTFSKVSRPPDLERHRSPVQYTDDFLADPSTDVMKGPSSSPPKSRRGTSVRRTPDYQYNPRSSTSAVALNDNTNVKEPVSHPIPKRNRSPGATGGLTSQMSSFPFDDDTERELQAKAKRLARFKVVPDDVEPSDLMQFDSGLTKKKISSTRTDQFATEKQKFLGNNHSGSPMETSQDLDNEDSQSCSVIVGLCPDMCPGSERAERERKGDLDQYERVDGDRNQTTKTLAVKKYTRTAEREAALIRPMAILQKTMDYLLNLLDQPYDDRFLGLYNFLWDRMRAIRMDLRMQHIFNLEAISMLEQMIRLHIIAMHELCEFSKGEGFSEGFDAHLNIEQMNKTSVELFQLYDDHRKRGVIVPTEKEFRGYYALLKLDKHPGYKVEPAELSLDLAKMTAEMRQTHEILFARDVARSCRTGNFIAFFRHARKASYLQSCLMHAHFSKLRTQALASLHSGLQSNQGLPVLLIAKWLGMEGEDVDSLLEYHGFAIKEFEEPYMVKEGPFLNADKDHPTRCSVLVHKKKSHTIVDDVLSCQAQPVPSQSQQEHQSDKGNKPDKNDETKHGVVQSVSKKSPLTVSDGVMDLDTVSSPVRRRQVQPFVETSRISQPFTEINSRVSVGSPTINIEIPKAFASSPSHKKPEQPSPTTPKDRSPFLGAGEMTCKSPLWNLSTPQFVADNSSTYFEPAKEGLFGGFVRSLPEKSSDDVQSEPSVMEPDIVPENGIKLTPPVCEVDSAIASSFQDDVFMKEMAVKEFADTQLVKNNDGTSYYDEEVAEAKLKLLLRRWRRHSARKREFREQNRLTAIAALSSLALGPPVRYDKDKPSPYQKLNIDRAINERYEKHQQSWARWNVSELVATELIEKNAESNCICWKAVLFSRLHCENIGSQARNSVTHISLDQWLQHKLIPSHKDEPVDDLVISTPGMAIWRKWVCSDSGDITCCLSVMKEAEPGNFEKKLVGASAIVYPVSETIPWELQKVQLHNLVMSLPSGACLPLLILSGLGEDSVAEMSCSIVDKLGLKDIDNSRVGNFLVISMNEMEGTGQYRGYFSDRKLKEGLMWLASGTHPQPVLYCVPMRELVTSHLNLCLDTLDFMGSDKVTPDVCISVFNNALEQSMNDIVTATNRNPTGWPCPELFLLENSSAECRAVSQFLPSLGWSSPEEVEPLLSAIRNLKLPCFSNETFLSNTGGDIEGQLQLLQDGLITYLTTSSNMMNIMLARQEAVVMLQKCTRLELHDVEYKVVPNWLLIFQRVFNWQLNSLASIRRGAYVLEQSHNPSSLPFLKESDFEVSTSHYMVHPSLDEMVDVSSNPVVSNISSLPEKVSNISSLAENFRNSPKMTFAQDAIMNTISNNSEEENNECSLIQIQPADYYNFTKKKDLELVVQKEQEGDRLSKLLEKCNTLQDEIEKKLAIYF